MRPSDYITVQTDTDTFDVRPLVLTAHEIHARTMAKYGQGIARNAPNLAQLRAMYCLPAEIRTWARMAVVLDSLKRTIDAHIYA